MTPLQRVIELSKTIGRMLVTTGLTPMGCALATSRVTESIRATLPPAARTSLDHYTHTLRGEFEALCDSNGVGAALVSDALSASLPELEDEG